jgi:hypothetical protein
MDPDFDTVVQWILCCGRRRDLLRKLECLALYKRHACEVVVADIFETVCSFSVVSTVSQGDQRRRFQVDLRLDECHRDGEYPSSSAL